MLLHLLGHRRFALRVVELLLVFELLLRPLLKPLLLNHLLLSQAVWRDCVAQAIDFCFDDARAVIVFILNGDGLSFIQLSELDADLLQPVNCLLDALALLKVLVLQSLLLGQLQGSKSLQCRRVKLRLIGYVVVKLVLALLVLLRLSDNFRVI